MKLKIKVKMRDAGRIKFRPVKADRPDVTVDRVDVTVDKTR
jgi:hypothetical protein